MRRTLRNRTQPEPQLTEREYTVRAERRFERDEYDHRIARRPDDTADSHLTRVSAETAAIDRDLTDARAGTIPDRLRRLGLTAAECAELLAHRRQQLGEQLPRLEHVAALQRGEATARMLQAARDRAATDTPPGDLPTGFLVRVDDSDQDVHAVLSELLGDERTAGVYGVIQRVVETVEPQRPDDPARPLMVRVGFSRHDSSLHLVLPVDRLEAVPPMSDLPEPTGSTA